MTLIEHLECYLGEISDGWKDSSPDNPIQVVTFRDQPYADINTYLTLGLGNQALNMSIGKPIRQELVFAAYKNFTSEQVASFLSTFANSIVSSGRGLLRGDVIGPSGPIILGSLLNSVYSAIPMIFPERFFVFEGTVPETIFPWVIPIHEDEANYIRANGWIKFEELLEQENPELWDLSRKSII
jgi:hypothetical protein